MTPLPRLRVPSPAPPNGKDSTAYGTVSNDPVLGVKSASTNDTTTTSSTSSPTTLKAARKYPHLLSYEELPEWCQDNIFIRHGYRPVSGSVAKSFGSLLYIHNESVNIWSHLLPAIGFLVAEVVVLKYLHANYALSTFKDDLVFSFFVFTAVVCLSFSSCYHTLTNHSTTVDALWLRMDFCGIIFLTLGDFVSGIYMVFWCEPTPRMIYWIMILTLGFADICILISPKFQGRPWRKFRVMCFVGTGMSGFAPLAHGLYLFGWNQMMKQSGMPFYLAEGALLGLGAYVYASRFPERLSPGRFDIYGASHQIFHVLVVLATVTQLVGIMHAYDYNYNHRICSSH